MNKNNNYLTLSNDSKIVYLQTIIFCCNNAAKNMKYSFYENQHYPMLDKVLIFVG
jgi:hypothetical protein